MDMSNLDEGTIVRIMTPAEYMEANPGSSVSERCALDYYAEQLCSITGRNVLGYKLELLDPDFVNMAAKYRFERDNYKPLSDFTWGPTSIVLADIHDDMPQDEFENILFGA